MDLKLSTLPVGINLFLAKINLKTLWNVFFSKGVINSECLSCEKISCDSHHHKALIDELYAYLSRF